MAKGLKNSQRDNPLIRLGEHGIETMGRFYSKYRGIVIDNNDPERLNRLQIIVPTTGDIDVDPIWAFPTGLYGGKGYGLQVIPEIGDTVYVEYEFGDTEHPIWTHGHYALEELPEEYETPYHFGFKTPGGSIVLINDNEGEEEIQIKLNSETDWVKLNKEVLELESKLIKLGIKGEEKAPVGETLLKKINELTDAVKDLTQIVSTHTHAGPTGPPTQAVEILKIKTSLTTKQEKFKEFLSEKVKIDK